MLCMSDLQAIELKLEKAKAYKSLLSHKFFKKETEITKLVEAELLGFVQSQLGKIFGMGKQETLLSAEDVGILKLVANKLISKTEDTEEESEDVQEEVEEEYVVPEPPEEPVKKVASPARKTAKVLPKQKNKPALQSATPIFSWHKQISTKEPGMTKNIDYSKLGLAKDTFESQQGDAVIVDRDKSKILIMIGRLNDSIQRYEEKLLRHASQGNFSANESLSGGVSVMATASTNPSVIGSMGDLSSSIVSHHVNRK